MTTEKKLTAEEFTVQAIKNLRKSPYPGINTVISGFNGAVKQYFGAETNPIDFTNALVAKDVIEGRPVKKGGRGYMIYLKGEMPKTGNTGEAALNVILNKPADVKVVTKKLRTAAKKLANKLAAVNVYLK